MFRCHICRQLSICSRNCCLYYPRIAPDYRFNEAEYNFLRGRNEVARVLLEEFVNTDPNAKLRARAAHHLSSIAKSNGDNEAHTYYLAISADADVVSATPRGCVAPGTRFYGICLGRYQQGLPLLVVGARKCRGVRSPAAYDRIVASIAYNRASTQ